MAAWQLGPNETDHLLLAIQFVSGGQADFAERTSYRVACLFSFSYSPLVTFFPTESGLLHSFQLLSSL